MADVRTQTIVTVKVNPCSGCFSSSQDECGAIQLSNDNLSYSGIAREFGMLVHQFPPLVRL